MIQRMLKCMSSIQSARAPMPVAGAPTWRRQQRLEADPDELLWTKQHSGSRSRLHRELESAKTEAQLVETKVAWTAREPRKFEGGGRPILLWLKCGATRRYRFNIIALLHIFQRSGGLWGHSFALLFQLFLLIRWSQSSHSLRPLSTAHHVLQPRHAGCGLQRAQSPPGQARRT